MNVKYPLVYIMTMFGTVLMCNVGNVGVHEKDKDK